MQTKQARRASLSAMNIPAYLRRALLALMAAATVAAGSCKKDASADPAKNSQSTNTELLTSGTWKIGKVEYDLKGGAWEDEGIPDYQQGFTLAFNDDNTYSAVSSDGAASGTWKFSADNTQLTIINAKGGSGGTFTLTTLSKTKLQLTQTRSFQILAPPDSNLGYYEYTGERDTFGH